MFTCNQVTNIIYNLKINIYTMDLVCRKYYFIKVRETWFFGYLVTKYILNLDSHTK